MTSQVREGLAWGSGALARLTSRPNLGRRQPDAARAAMDRIKLLLD